MWSHDWSSTYIEGNGGISTPETIVEVANRLKEKNIFLAVRCGGFCIAPYLDSTSEDVDQVM